MSIEITGNARPSRPGLAIVVTALLLVLTIGGAAWLTRARNHPVAMGTPHLVQGIPGVRIAWPEGWVPVRVTSRPGARMVAVGEPVGEATGQHVERIMILVTGKVADEVIRPERATEVLLSTIARQLGLVPGTRQITTTRETMGGLAAAQIRCPVGYQDEPWGMQMRTVCEANGRAVALLLLSPQQITPADERVMDTVSSSMQLSQSSSPSKQPPTEGQDEQTTAQPI